METRRCRSQTLMKRGESCVRLLASVEFRQMYNGWIHQTINLNDIELKFIML